MMAHSQEDHESAFTHERRLIEAGRRDACDGTGGPGAPYAQEGEAGPESVPGYTLLGELHRGSQGVVYRAVQRATGRAVAVKILHEGPALASAETARFEREVRVLSRLQHPHIVAVLDSGNALGKHYFVMDYLDGQRLDAYLDEHERTIEAILLLFATICEAVNAAHLRGVIHRDLKPGNILVDWDGTPHILDFGLAKFAPGEGLDISQWRALTMTGQFVGSLLWASPEQAEGPPDRVDLRTDVYSLGVLLYHMLTQEFPYAVTGSVREILEQIVQTEPRRPSTVRREIDDDLDTIILKSLAKAPERRYQTAGELARDVRHYLAGEPLEAKRDSTWYVFRKTLRRYRIAAALAGTFVVLVTLSAIALSLMYQRARRDRTIAEVAGEAEQVARMAAEHEAQKASQVRRFLENMLASADPYEGSGREVTVIELLDDAVRRADSDLRGQPELEVSLRKTIGLTYMSLGKYDAAERQLRRARETALRVLGGEHPEAIASTHGLARVKHKQHQFSQAAALYREAFAGFRRQFGEDDPRTLAAADDLAVALFEQGIVEEAQELFRKTLMFKRRILGDQAPETLTTINNLASLQQTLGRIADAERLFREALLGFESSLGRDHPKVLVLKTNLAVLLKTSGRADEAAEFAQEALHASEAKLGEDHPDTLKFRGNLATIRRAQGRLADAEALNRKVLASRTRVLGPDHPETFEAMNNLAAGLLAQDKLEEAQEWYRRAFEGAAASSIVKADKRLIFRGNYGHCLARLGRFEEGEANLLDAHKEMAILLGESHKRTTKVADSLVKLYEAWGKPEEAAMWQAKLGNAAAPP